MARCSDVYVRLVQVLPSECPRCGSEGRPYIKPDGKLYYIHESGEQREQHHIANIRRLMGEMGFECRE